MSSAPIPDPSHLSSSLLTWLSAARRDLPWRRRRDPYAVWVSEIMLQQTQVATVAPYFERWMTRFPDVRALAHAALDDVLKTWEGLGYYARPRNLRRAAQQIVAEHGGELPADREALLSLPGIGRYTAGAILSLAFGQAEPVLDGNVRRVLCRFYDIAGDPKQPATERRLWALAKSWVEAALPGQAGNLNEGLMELGALVCTPGLPDCAACPLAEGCQAHAHGTEAQRPAMAARRQTPHYDVTAGVLQDADGRYLIVRRPIQGLLGGLWGFPGSSAGACGGETDRPETPGDCLARALRETLGIDVTVGEALPAIRHAYTHFRITLHPFRCRLMGGEPQALGYPELRWVAAAELTGYAFPVADRKIADGLQGD
jgi:A/G-specific adenine glycosylase